MRPAQVTPPINGDLTATNERASWICRSRYALALRSPLLAVQGSEEPIRLDKPEGRGRGEGLELRPRAAVDGQLYEDRLHRRAPTQRMHMGPRPQVPLLPEARAAERATSAHGRGLPEPDGATTRLRREGR